MRDLHVVAVSDDGRHVVLATSADAKKGTFRVPLDARLRSAVQGRLTTRPTSAPPAEQPTVSVREIQARLRAGESAQDIAASAGVALERIERFAGPVRSEQEKMIEAARATPLVHSRRGLSALPLGEAVDLHFSQIDSLRPDSVEWSARREEAGTWLVEVSYVARARTRSGTWRYDAAARTLVAADSVSASLGHSETADGAPAASAPKRRGAGAARAGAKPRAKAPVEGSATRAAAPATVTAKPQAAAPAAAAKPRRSAAPAAPPRAPAAVRTTPGTKAAPVVARPGAQGTGRSARSATPAATPATSRTPTARGRAAVPKPPAAAKPAADVPAGPPTLRVVPALDQQPRQPPGGRGSGRASVPAWADVLLSTSPPAADKDAASEEASSD